MTYKEYEQTYQEALQSLKQQGKKVAGHYWTHDSVRGVHIDDFPCTDKRVFDLAWGEETASGIMREWLSPLPSGG